MTNFPTTASIAEDVRKALLATGVDIDAISGDTEMRTPITGGVILRTKLTSESEIDQAVAPARDAFRTWREVPAPLRGALVKRWGQLLSDYKSELATLVTAEVGKIRSEALGEVQR